MTMDSLNWRKIIWREWLHTVDTEIATHLCNTLMCSSLFDFNQIEISCATDQQVERFAVRMGNDTDPVRQAIYPQVICVIASDCQISENSRRILQSLFGSNLRDRHS